MTSYRFGDIVLVPFPFTDQTTTKKRPAVVISSENYNQHHLDLIVMAITSQQQATILPDHLVVADWQGASLLKPSVIKPIAATVEKALVIRTLGRLQSIDRQSLQTLLEQIFRE